MAKDGSSARVAFVSIDDDPRETTKFVKDSGMKDTLYLGDTTERAKFLRAVGGGSSLPMQIFVDPSGSIRCVAQGEITEADYAEIAALVAKK